MPRPLCQLTRGSRRKCARANAKNPSAGAIVSRQFRFTFIHKTYFHARFASLRNWPRGKCELPALLLRQKRHHFGGKPQSFAHRGHDQPNSHSTFHNYVQHAGRKTGVAKFTLPCVQWRIITRQARGQDAAAKFTRRANPLLPPQRVIFQQRRRIRLAHHARVNHSMMR